MIAERGQRGFEDLECYQLALQVLQEVYRVVKRLPVEEKYNLADQMRRASVSVGLNIAEGYGRYHYLDSLRFYYIARGSLDETLSGFIICDKLGYTSKELFRQRELCHSDLRSMATSVTSVSSNRDVKNTAADSSTKIAHPIQALPSQQKSNQPVYQFTNIAMYHQGGSLLARLKYLRGAKNEVCRNRI